MIELKNINKTYKSKHSSVTALQKVSITLPDRGMVFIAGKSGCGKTTLLNVLGGLDGFDSGEFYYNDESTKEYRNADWDKYRNSFVGFVFQENNLLEEYNVYENVKLAINLQGAKNESDTVSDALKYVGLDGYQKRNINELSGGQKQRVTIARAIAKSSRILLADEPTGSLDESTGRDVFYLLKTLSETQLVVVVTHDITSAKIYGDMLIEMSDGRITAVTNLKEITNKQVVYSKAKKSQLKPSIYFTLATKSFKQAPFRLFVLVLLSMFGFSLMTGALKFSFWQPYELQNQVIESNGKAIISRTPITIEHGGLGRIEERFFNSNDLTNFKNKFQNIKVFNVAELSGLYGGININYNQLNERNQIYYTPAFQGTISINSHDLELFGIELLAGEFPSTQWGPYDVAISEYLFEIYSIANYIENGLDEIEIKNYEDLIGKKLYDNKYTIRGVLNTHFLKEEYRFIKEYALGIHDNFSIDWTTEFSRYAQIGFHNSLFMNPNYDSEKNSKYLIIPYDEVVFSDSNFIRAIFDSSDYLFVDYYSQILKYQASDSASFGNIMIVIALVAIAFAVILFANFISVSIYDKMRQIGILRALGATKKSITFIFILQSIIIALIVLAFSSLMINFAIMPLLLIMGTTSTFPFPWYSIKFIDYVILFGLIAITAIVSSLLPLVRLVKKTPREIIASSK
jgi:ABC-type lipoprotein export system ATPase subunit